MASITDIGTSGSHMDSPPITPWQAAVRDALNSSDTTVDARISSSVAPKLDKAGGTMTGPLVLSGAPTLSMHAATRDYALNGATAWANLPLSNGWTGSVTPQWRRTRGGMIAVRGTIAGGTVGSSVTALTLPVGARPGTALEFPQMCSGNGLARLSLTTAGAICVTSVGAGTNAWVSVTVSFAVDS